uniref:NADH-ubiquinone oxidoreductase chain 2 n=1 Tax=Onthophagus cf. jeannelianus TaxID=1848579 RepID=A0A1X9HDV6_9SCAR|nr:NADH deshydrogenase subunit 2 [Onthophagus cf. jeannelianus]
MYLQKMIFMFTLMTGTLISISSYSWFGMWLGLEINLLSIIPLMSSPKNSMASEATMKYFITQTLASMILLFSLIFMSMNINYLIFHTSLSLTFSSSLFIKMGAAPFHFWFPEIMEGLTWTNSFIMLTWQKIAPMTLFSYTNFSNINYITFIVIFSSMISGIMGMNQTNMRKILAYSSINHISWMLMSMLFFETIWIYYFIIYSIISLNIILILNKFNIFYLSQLFSSINNFPIIKFFFMLNFMSLGGLPPFLGFLPKWLTIQILIKMNLFSLSLIIIIMTLITLFFYMRIITLGLMMNINYNLISKNYYIKKFNTIYLINFIMLMSLILITITFNMY